MGIVKAFNVFKDRQTSLGPSAKCVMMDQFRFQRGKETLDHGIIPTIPDPTHRRTDAPARELAPIGRAGILAAPIRMVDQAPGPEGGSYIG